MIDTPEQPEQSEYSPNSSTDSPTLPAFDRTVPPNTSDLPPLMHTGQIAGVMGISVDNARTSGNRKKFGAATVIDGKSFYKREEVVREWHRRFTPKTQVEKHVEQAKHPERSPNTGDKEERLLVLLERKAEHESANDATIGELVRLVNSQRDEIQDLRKQLQQGRGIAEKPARTFWQRLFGGS